MRTLSETIKYGWPETKGEIPVSIHAYWDVRDELSELNDVVLRGERIAIPPSMRKEMLEKIHQGHMGIEKSKRRARDTLYWPGMNSQITDTVSRCTICLEHRRQNAKEPMIPFRVTTKPWELVATDLFTWDKSEYVIIVDYHSRFFEVAKLPDTKRITVITHLKSAFARHGIPSEVISDNGPQYSSKEFESFAKSWEFKHTTTSPLNPKANGLVEKAVQTMKSLLTKAKQDSRDPYLALLEYRNTPIDDVGSPAQLLMSRRLRSIIPTSDALLKPKVLDAHKVMEKMELKQRKQKHYFDRQTKALPVLETGDRIRVRMGNSCKPGRVVQHAETPRSYEIQTDEGRKYRRNRRMLIKCSEDDRSSIDSPFVSNSPTTSTHERPYFKESVDKVSPLVEGPTVTLPQPEELCSTDEDIKERQP